jgi:hypothetical protein
LNTSHRCLNNARVHGRTCSPQLVPQQLGPGTPGSMLRVPCCVLLCVSFPCRHMCTGGTFRRHLAGHRLIVWPGMSAHAPPSSRLVSAWVGPAGLVGDGQVGEGHHKKLCQSVAMSNAWRRGGGTAGRDSFMAGMYPLTTSIAPTSRASRGYVQTLPQRMVLPPAATLPGWHAMPSGPAPQ